MIFWGSYININPWNHVFPSELMNKRAFVFQNYFQPSELTANLHIFIHLSSLFLFHYTNKISTLNSLKILEITLIMI